MSVPDDIPASKPPARAPSAASACATAGCNVIVPEDLAAERLCLMHFTLAVEQSCAEMRRKIASGATSAEARTEIDHYINEKSLLLARAATSDPQLTDQMKKRVLSTFLTLMNQREHLNEPGRTWTVEELKPRRARA